MQQLRFRMFAGPNGSGKTHLFEYLKRLNFIHMKIYLTQEAFIIDNSEQFRIIAQQNNWNLLMMNENMPAILKLQLK